MPNWCEGTLKVRGQIKDLRNFMLNAVKPVDIIGEFLEPLKPYYEGEDVISFHIKDNSCWLEHTTRGFMKPCYVSIEGELEEETIIYFPAKFAWNIYPEELLTLCEQYNVDMKIYAFELGMMFERDVEIVNGKIIADNTKKYEEPKDYWWNCICPDLGG